MAELRIPVVMNKGRKGMPLHKLARISSELQQFLDLLGEDLQIEPGAGWLGTGFYDGSFGFTAEKVDPVEDRKVRAFKHAFRNVAKRKQDARVRPSTIRQYARIAEPIGLEEIVEFGLPKSDADEQTEEWCELTKQEALLIASDVQSIVRSHGGVQGVIHSVFFGASPPHFQLRELSTGELVKCIYSTRRQYDELAIALKQHNAVVHVYGIIRTDLVNHQIEELRVDKIQLAETFSKEDFNRFVGSAPAMLGNQSLQDFIDSVRGRAD
jgi:hypothetical protein